MTKIEQEHIELAKNGVQQGFNFLVKEYWMYLYNFIVNKTQDEYLSEEICIESFAKAFDKIDQFKMQYEFKTWLVQIAKNRLIDEYRKKDIETQTLTQNNLKIAEETTTDHLEEKTKNEEIVLSELNKLPTDYQLILKKYYLESMSFKEISEELNIPINNLKVKAFRAKQKLQTNMLKKME